DGAAHAAVLRRTLPGLAPFLLVEIEEPQPAAGAAVDKRARIGAIRHRVVEPIGWAAGRVEAGPLAGRESQPPHSPTQLMADQLPVWPHGRLVGAVAEEHGLLVRGVLERMIDVARTRRRLALILGQGHRPIAARVESFHGPVVNADRLDRAAGRLEGK